MNKNVLVAIMNNPGDFEIARSRNWYRIPVASANRMLNHVWPPEWLAFYHTKVFDDHAFSIRYYAKIKDITQARRAELFPEVPHLDNADKLYFKLELEPLIKLKKPIFSRKQRRILFIPTTMQKFKSALEINDLFSGSHLEDKLWAVLKRLKIPAQRQELVTAFYNRYLLDFSLYCAEGKIDVETDGDIWHHNPQKAEKDNRRNNDLAAAGWHILRFTSKQILEQMYLYCLHCIVEKINNLGGIEINTQQYRQIELCISGSDARVKWH